MGQVIPKLLADGTMCSTVDLMLMEWHPVAVETVPPNVSARYAQTLLIGLPWIG